MPFERRVHCDAGCSKTNPDLHQAQSDKFTEARRKITKVCEICGRHYSRGKEESNSVFRTRHTCSRKCCDIKRVRDAEEERKKEPGKVCENPDCGKTFYRQRYSNGLLESKKRFGARRACNTKCGAVVRLKNNQWTKKGSGGGKKPRTVTKKFLPPSNPPKIDIPMAPQPTEVTVWRPAVWGGSYTRKIGA